MGKKSKKVVVPGQARLLKRKKGREKFKKETEKQASRKG
jgi:hypothetical protein